MSDAVELSDAEWLVMNLVWDRQPIMAVGMAGVLAQEKPGLHLMCRSGLEPFYQRFGFVRVEPSARPYSLRLLPWLGTLMTRWQGGEGVSVMRHRSA